jgi:DNA-binding protein YbaB
MNNAMNYENTIAQAAAVSANLAEMARTDLEAATFTTGKAAKAGAVVLTFNGPALPYWLDAYRELLADGNKAAAQVVKATLNTASGKIKDDDGVRKYAGNVSIQKIDGRYGFVMSKPKAADDKPESVLIEAAKALVAGGLSDDAQAVLADLLTEKATSLI